MSYAYHNLAIRIRRDYLEPGKLPLGEKLPTIREMARQYKASAPTISKAIELLTVDGWLVKQQGSGIYIAALPQAKDEEKKHCKIGCIISNFRLALAHHVLEGVNYVARHRNCVLEVGTSDGKVDQERDQVQAMRDHGVEGVVLYCTRVTPSDSKEHFLTNEFRDYPIVVVDLYEREMRRPHVIIDNYNAAREMTRYLLAQGRERTAFLRFKGKCRPLDDREAGYRQALKEANLADMTCVLEFDWMPTGMSKVDSLIETLLKMEPYPNGIIMPTDSFVPGAIAYLRQQGFSVPKDIILTGFDNLSGDYPEDHWPTTSPDFVRMGERAAEMLLERIESGNLEVTEAILPCPLVLPPLSTASAATISSGHMESLNATFTAKPRSYSPLGK